MRYLKNRIRTMQTTIHNGPLSTIASQTTTPGLQFLKSFLPALDCLDPKLTSSNPDAYSINRFLSPSVTFQTNSNPPTQGRDVVRLLRLRGKHLSVLRHEIDVIWDIEKDDFSSYPSSYPETGTEAKTKVNHGLVGFSSDGPGPGMSSKEIERRHQRTVMFEGTSVTTFRDDGDQFPVRLREFNILDLETGLGMLDHKVDNQCEGLKVVQMRTYLDARPLQDRAAMLRPESTKL